jgi:hypothetical protein
MILDFKKRNYLKKKKVSRLNYLIFQLSLALESICSCS